MLLKGKSWVFINSFLWFISGSWLLFKGLIFFDQAFLASPTSIAPDSLYRMLGSAENVCTAHIMASVVIGFIKGRWVLAKTAKCVTQRILSLPNLCPISSIYSRSYLIMLSSMILLGVSMKWLAIPYDVKGVIDIAIGSALTNGAALYFRHFAEAKNKV